MMLRKLTGQTSILARAAGRTSRLALTVEQRAHHSLRYPPVVTRTANAQSSAGCRAYATQTSSPGNGDGKNGPESDDVPPPDFDYTSALERIAESDFIQKVVPPTDRTRLEKVHSLLLLIVSYLNRGATVSEDAALSMMVTFSTVAVPPDSEIARARKATVKLIDAIVRTLLAVPEGSQTRTEQSEIFGFAGAMLPLHAMYVQGKEPGADLTLQEWTDFWNRMQPLLLDLMFALEKKGYHDPSSPLLPQKPGLPAHYLRPSSIRLFLNIQQRAPIPNLFRSRPCVLRARLGSEASEACTAARLNFLPITAQGSTPLRFQSLALKNLAQLSRFAALLQSDPGVAPQVRYLYISGFDTGLNAQRTPMRLWIQAVIDIIIDSVAPHIRVLHIFGNTYHLGNILHSHRTFTNLQELTISWVATAPFDLQPATTFPALRDMHLRSIDTFLDTPSTRVVRVMKLLPTLAPRLTHLRMPFGNVVVWHLSKGRKLPDHMAALKEVTICVPDMLTPAMHSRFMLLKGLSAEDARLRFKAERFEANDDLAAEAQWLQRVSCI
ncbi:hypothetical protein FB107DRAFT_294421 [Schizophyllum commune]